MNSKVNMYGLCASTKAIKTAWKLASQHPEQTINLSIVEQTDSCPSGDREALFRNKYTWHGWTTVAPAWSCWPLFFSLHDYNEHAALQLVKSFWFECSPYSLACWHVIVQVNEYIFTCRPGKLAHAFLMLDELAKTLPELLEVVCSFP